MLREEEKAIRRAKRLQAGLTIIHPYHPDSPAAPAPKKPLAPSQIIIPGFHNQAAADHQDWNLQYCLRNYTEEEPYHPVHHQSSSPVKQNYHSLSPKLPHHPDSPAAAPKKPLTSSQIIIPGLHNKAAADHQDWNLQYHPRNYAEEEPYHPENQQPSLSMKDHNYLPPKMPHHPEQHRSSPPPTKDHARSPEYGKPPKMPQHPEQHRSSSPPTKDHLSENPKPIIKVDKCGTDDRIQEPSATGVKRTFQPSDEDAGPSAKRLHQSSGRDAAGSSSLRVKKEPLPRNPDIFHDVYKWIKDVEQEEYQRRKQMVEDLVKHCKAIPLTVKMSNPLINVNALPNIIN